MNFLQKLGRQLVHKSFKLSVWLIERRRDSAACAAQLAAWRELPVGTLGRDIVACLDENELRLVPGYESHDLKHVLLGFEMTPDDEIKMQAFMLGNGNYSLPCLAILLFGLGFLPHLWPLCWREFQRGRRVQPISGWTIGEYAPRQTRTLQHSLRASARPGFNLSAVVKGGALASISLGLIGMLVCLSFLFSAALPDLVGAGFPFVAGAVLVVGGLLALSNVARSQPAANLS